MALGGYPKDSYDLPSAVTMVQHSFTARGADGHKLPPAHGKGRAWIHYGGDLFLRCWGGGSMWIQIYPPRKTHISYLLEKENHRLKSAVGGDILVRRRVSSPITNKMAAFYRRKKKRTKKNRVQVCPVVTTNPTLHALLFSGFGRSIKLTIYLYTSTSITPKEVSHEKNPTLLSIILVV